MGSVFFGEETYEKHTSEKDSGKEANAANL